MQTLTSGQQIKTTIDRDQPIILVGTIAGYAAEIGGDPEQMMRRSRQFGWETAWTIKAPAIIEAPYPGIELRRAKEAEAYAAAVTVEDGEIVEIDGLQYYARYVRRDVSDPVKFDLIV